MEEREDIFSVLGGAYWISGIQLPHGLRISEMRNIFSTFLRSGLVFGLVWCLVNEESGFIGAGWREENKLEI